MIKVKLISSDEELEQAYRIREEVFVVEQQVPKNLEYDEFESECRHFIALSDGFPCATARWRFTKKGIKLERFAVLQAFRSKGIGSELVKNVLEDIANIPETKGKLIYLHAQVSAVPLYLKFGFGKEGEPFEEAGIEHYVMVKNS